MALGAPVGLVERSLATRDPLPGTCGFAGELPDGRLVRDVLGRRPLFVDGEAWSHDPTALANPESFPAGHVREEGERRAVWTLPDPGPADADEALAAVSDALSGALDALDPQGVAVAFSGGVDSALVASALDAPLYVAGFEGSQDVAAARDATERMGRVDDLRVVTLTHEVIERAVPRVARAIRRSNAMDVSIALPLFCAAERAASEGYERVAVGQGADELFGGYEKVAAPDHRVAADTVRGARRETMLGLPDQLERDVLALRAAGVEPVAPLLCDGVVRAALALPEELLVDGDERKVALRRVARERLPGAVANREKKAVQYGSLVSRELDRLARQAGFKRRIGDHVTKYVEYRLGERSAP